MKEIPLNFEEYMKSTSTWYIIISTNLCANTYFIFVNLYEKIRFLRYWRLIVMIINFQNQIS